MLDRPRHISDKCSYTPKKCRYGCGEYFCRKDLPVHEQDECPKREFIIESDRRNKKKLKELEMKYHKQEALLKQYKNEMDEQKQIRKEEAETYKMEKAVVEKQLRKREHLYENQHLLQKKISKMEQEQSLLQGNCNVHNNLYIIFTLFEGSFVPFEFSHYN